MRGLRHLGPHDGQLALSLGVIEPVVEAAALDRVVQLTGAVAGEYGHRAHLGPQRAEFGNTDLVLAQVLQQKGLKGLVGPVHLVDQQHGARRRGLQCLQQWPADQVARLVHLALYLGHVGLAALRGTHVQQLGGVVPFVQGFALLQPVVALQAQQLPAQHFGECLGEFGLADAGLAFEQERALQLERQKNSRGQPAVGVVAGRLKGSHQGINTGKIGHLRYP